MLTQAKLLSAPVTEAVSGGVIRRDYDRIKIRSDTE